MGDDASGNQLQHEEIWQRLQSFYAAEQVPNLLFYGPAGAGKKTLVFRLLGLIYGEERELWKDVVLVANCAHGKGIKFIREELKFFARTNAHAACACNFKSVVLTNAENLTVDAQSALRRCIELYCHNTRFFLVVTSQSSLMKPILSRFCDIYVPPPTKVTCAPSATVDSSRLKQMVQRLSKLRDSAALAAACQDVVYNEAICALDIMRLVQEDKIVVENLARKYELLMCFDSLRKEVRSEPMLMYCLLHMLFLEKSASITDHLEGFCF